MLLNAVTPLGDGQGAVSALRRMGPGRRAEQRNLAASPRFSTTRCRTVSLRVMFNWWDVSDMPGRLSRLFGIVSPCEC